MVNFLHNPASPLVNRIFSAPVAAITENHEPRVEGKMAMFALFQRFSDDFDEMTIMSLIGAMVHFYRPLREFRLCPLDMKDRENAAMTVLKTLLQLWAPTDEQLAGFVHDMFLFKYSPNVIRWILGTAEKTLAEDRKRSSVIHAAIRDKLPMKNPQTMALIINKTLNLHRVHENEQGYRSTPTSLAMCQAGLFFAWRDVVMHFEDVNSFVKAELLENSSLLANEGWAFKNLSALFTIEPNVFLDSKYEDNSSQLKCDRCGRWEETYCLMVDLEWRRFLRSIREGISLRFKDKEPAVLREPTSTKVEVEPACTALGSDIRFICSWECQDEICLAWTCDNDSPEVGRAVQSGITARPENELEDCPTRAMPGAFIV